MGFAAKFENAASEQSLNSAGVLMSGPFICSICRIATNDPGSHKCDFGWVIVELDHPPVLLPMPPVRLDERSLLALMAASILPSCDAHAANATVTNAELAVSDAKWLLDIVDKDLSNKAQSATDNPQPSNTGPLTAGLQHALNIINRAPGAAEPKTLELREFLFRIRSELTVLMNVGNAHPPAAPPPGAADQLPAYWTRKSMTGGWIFSVGYQRPDGPEGNQPWIPLYVAPMHSAAPVAWRMLINSAYELHPRYVFTDDDAQPAGSGTWEPLYLGPPHSTDISKVEDILCAGVVTSDPHARRITLAFENDLQFAAAELVIGLGNISPHSAATVPSEVPEVVVSAEGAEEPNQFTRAWKVHACEEIDAGFFSGDDFHDPHDLARIEWYIGRWQREIVAIKKQNADE